MYISILELFILQMEEAQLQLADGKREPIDRKDREVSWHIGFRNHDV